MQSFHAKVADQPGADVESGQQVRLSLSLSLSSLLYYFCSILFNVIRLQRAASPKPVVKFNKTLTLMTPVKPMLAKYDDSRFNVYIFFGLHFFLNRA